MRHVGELRERIVRAVERRTRRDDGAGALLSCSALIAALLLTGCGGGDDGSGCSPMPVSSMSVGDTAPVIVRVSDLRQMEFDLDGVGWSSRSPVPEQVLANGAIPGTATLVDHWQFDMEGSAEVDLGDVGVITFVGGPPGCL